MERLVRQLLRNQSGQSVLVMVLILLVLGGLITGPLLGFMDTGLKAGQTHEELSSRLYAADSGVEDGIHWIIMGKQTEDWPWAGNETVGWQRDTYIINESSVNVAVHDLGSNFYEITSTATSADGSTTVLSTVWAAAEPLTLEGFDGLGPRDRWDGDAYVDGNGELSGNVTGNVYVTGNLTLKSEHSRIGGDVSVGGDFVLGSNSAVSGNACCGGNLLLHAHSHVHGDVYMTVEGSRTIDLRAWATTGDMYVDGSGSITIKLAEQAEVGNIYVTNNVTLWYDGEATQRGIIDEDWDGAEPPPPDCPDIPVAGSKILTYEIL